VLDFFDRIFFLTSRSIDISPKNYATATVPMKPVPDPKNGTVPVIMFGHWPWGIIVRKGFPEDDFWHRY